MRVSFRNERGQWDLAAVAAIVLLAFSFAFGGASRENAIRLALIELASLPVLVIALTTIAQRGLWREHRFALILVGAALLLPLIQLIPLPPAIWTGLPGRDQARLALEIAQLPQGWLPLSFTPDLTWQSLLAMLPAVAMALFVLGRDHRFAEKLVLGVLLAAMASATLGVLQVTTGQLYVWATSYRGELAGLFSNRNHQADLCLISMPFIAMLGGRALMRPPRERLMLWLALLAIGFLLVVLGVIRSRTGVLLLPLALGGSLLVGWLAAGRARLGWRTVSAGAAGVVIFAGLSVFALEPTIKRFEAVSGQAEGRFDNWPYAAKAAQDLLPVGGGLGSFDTVYRAVEPLHLLDATYFNHAHNEYLHMWVEAGWLGIALIVAFLVWFARRSWRAWRSGPGPGKDLMRASTVAIAVLLVHSFGDYPLRTMALAVSFGLFCAILELTPVAAERTRRRRRED